MIATSDALVTPARSGVVRRVPSKVAAGLSFLGWLYLAISLFLYSWIIGTQLLMGWHPMLVTSGSMSPAIRVGDVVMVGEEPPGVLGQQTVILFDDPHDEERTVLHRIVTVRGDGSYETRGDANADSDVAAVRPHQIEGVGRMVIPAVGAPFAWLQAGEQSKVAAWIAGSMVAVWFAFRRPKKRAPHDGNAGVTS